MDSDEHSFHTPISSEGEDDIPVVPSVVVKEIESEEDEPIVEEVQQEETIEDDKEEEGDQIIIPTDAKLAENQKAEGNTLYLAGNYAGAVEAYTQAIILAPKDDDYKDTLGLFYCNRAAAHLMLKNYHKCIADANDCLAAKPNYGKGLLRRAKAYEKLDDLSESLNDYKTIVELHPEITEARIAVTRLEPLVAKRFEEQKEQMFGKLKDLGNSVLGKFGMSLDNFQAIQDPNTGSYSVNFTQ